MRASANICCLSEIQSRGAEKNGKVAHVYLGRVVAM